MDSNQTRFHLLLGERDWQRCRTTGGVPAFPEGGQVYWNAPRNEVTLWPETCRFAGAKSDRPVVVDDRRGAASDAFGNWYWIAPDRQSILVLSSGSQSVSVFWPAEPAVRSAVRGDGGFGPRAAVAPASLTLQGLAVTVDHYLVAGTVAPGGVLVFDLYSVGAPRQRLWPVPFDPFDLVQCKNGGVWIRDRTHRAVWQLDRRFEVVADSAGPAAATGGGAFAPEAGDVAAANVVVRASLRPQQGTTVAAADAVAIEALPDGAVLVLDRDDGSGFACVHLLEGSTVRGAPASTRGMAQHVEPDASGEPFRLAGHDFALGSRDAEDPPGWLGRLYIVWTDGNQAYAFGVERRGDQLVLQPLAEYFPMRLFGGRALVASAGDPWYDCRDTWAQLVRQKRPRHVSEGELWTPVFDSGIPDCVWHRMMLDACIPPGAAVDVYTRAADDWRELTLSEWLSAPERRALGAPDVAEAGDAVSEDGLAQWRAEPSPYLRGGGSELPYLPIEATAKRGTWELLFQRARGRYLQIRLVLRGDGRSTPRLRALRAWYPRFSYLEHYLPAVYREDAESASFLDRFLANIEGLFTAIEDRIAAAQLLFDVQSAPAEAIDWLGKWFGVALDPSWEDHRKRLFLRHAVDFFAARGTERGLQLALRLALDECVDERLFAYPERAARRAAPIRIIERFRARRMPPALLGDVSTAVPGPQRLDPGARWQPAAGAAELHRRYRAALTLAAGTEGPRVEAGAPAGWSDFAGAQLGFVPRAGAAERASWLAFLARTHPSVTVTALPADEPAAGIAADWQAFLADTHNRERELWQDFLARRYRSGAVLNAAWRKSWSSFSAVALPDRLPADVAPLADWYQFEGTVLAMHRAAHRFTVMLPVPRHMRTDTPAQQRRLALAKTVLDLEKPAHTVYDMRFYWAMFRLGEARLGDDTLIDLGSRAPELMAPMVLGEGYLAEAYLAVPPGKDAPGRLVTGRDRVGRSARLGGP